MGVRGLQTYLEKYCPSASPIVRIPELISEYRERSSNEEVVIVVDGYNFLCRLYGDLEWIGGGQLRQFGEKSKKFVQAFKNEGITLIFYFGGTESNHKLQTWRDRKYRSLNDVYNLFNELNQGTPAKDMPKTCLHLPPGLRSLEIFETYGCQVYQSFVGRDKEIVEYARTHNVFGILAQDTDYVIMDTGNALYFSLRHLDLEKMTTRQYNRQELARLLNIQLSQLPLLATLIGNDILPSQDLKKFQRTITRQYDLSKNISFTKLFPSVARYVHYLPLHQDQLRNKLPEIARTVLGCASRVSEITVSLQRYETTPNRENEIEGRESDDPWFRVMTEARRRHRYNLNPGCIFSVMNGLHFESSTSLEDYSQDDLPTFIKMTQPIRERIYGILLQEKPLPESGVHLVPELCMAGPGSVDQPNYVPAVPPAPPHPGLLALWLDEGELLSTRWHLFVSSVSPDLNVSRARGLLIIDLVCFSSTPRVVSTVAGRGRAVVYPLALVCVQCVSGPECL
ncbi:constitutive coactivator of peroxisome proliferator-activated receptor gamma-like [Homalodisca vitripennis]|uniref:constitutive coactivator of peroxisome proliferator-activated receptor gamma-like n=1 Tax=Homalodisca vitripennis TaxID=197043 RepID=UPI001EEBD459|nr:constitutive coactivator of peroxisome proliferator-activated receptor gamma-like [Homalodisca vitripennis]XP_046669812.1 constitutive coactivator of peroxisome proliferator-activated receptor gamma-like [Homalodisca vitripennis]